MLREPQSFEEAVEALSELRVLVKEYATFLERRKLLDVFSRERASGGRAPAQPHASHRHEAESQYVDSGEEGMLAQRSLPKVRGLRKGGRARNGGDGDGNDDGGNGGSGGGGIGALEKHARHIAALVDRNQRKAREKEALARRLERRAKIKSRRILVAAACLRDREAPGGGSSGADPETSAGSDGEAHSALLPQPPIDGRGHRTRRPFGGGDNQCAAVARRVRGRRLAEATQRHGEVSDDERWRPARGRLPKKPPVGKGPGGSRPRPSPKASPRRSPRSSPPAAAVAATANTSPPPLPPEPGPEPEPEPKPESERVAKAAKHPASPGASVASMQG